MTAADEAAALPLRTAQALHALMARWRDAGGSAPITAAQVCEYDETALTVRHTAAALAHARRLGLADGYDGLWFATSAAWDMRKALEDRVLAEHDEREEPAR